MTYLAAHAGMLFTRLLEHIMLVGVSATAAFIIALPLGIAVAERPFADLVLGVLSVIYTIPSLALFALLVPIAGLGTPTAILVLTLYGLMIFTRAVVLGLRGVPAAIRESAVAMGMSRIERLRRVEVPLAAPVIIAGARTAIVVLIATASVAAWIDAGGLGVLLFEGIRQDDGRRIIIGSILTAALAVAADAGLSALEQRVGV